MTAAARLRIDHEHRELLRCLALLADAIARAERWYARQEAELAEFDRHARSAVERLRTGGWVERSPAWDPAAAAR